jgi:NAD(P)-dependent dehydrogenase (short-subunit alcohol dehydrogenase family)
LQMRGEIMSPIAIVTASDSGIGQESAKELAENGFDLGITYRTDEAGAQETLEAVRAAGRRGEVRRLDLTELPGLRTLSTSWPTLWAAWMCWSTTPEPATRRASS